MIDQKEMGKNVIDTTLDGFRKRDGHLVAFNQDKISVAIYKAFSEVAKRNDTTTSKSDAEKISVEVLNRLNDPNSPYYVKRESGKRIADIEFVQNLVELVLAEMGLVEAMVQFKNYRLKRQNARNKLKIRTKLDNTSQDTTDALLLVESNTGNLSTPWDKSRIVTQLLEETNLSLENSIAVAKRVENKVLLGNYSTINTSLVREMTNNELSELGFNAELKDQSLFSIPKSTVEQLLYFKSSENSNVKNNSPEAISQSISEMIKKPWALQNIFGSQLERAHATGRIHIHDLGFPDRVYCSSHSIEYIKKFGLTGLLNLNSESKPANSAQVLTGHLNTFLASMQAYYAGALGIAYINIMYAPLLDGASEKEMHQRAQELIFNGSQNAFARGGQTIFLDFNIHSGVPSYLKKVPAVGPSGKYMLWTKDGQRVKLTEIRRNEKSKSGRPLMELQYDGRVVLREILEKDGSIIYDPAVECELADAGERIVTYGDYEETARQFALAMLKVWEQGDMNGKVFEFPKCDFHVSDETYDDPAQHAILERAIEVASRNGSVYFIFDRDQVTLSACCRLRTTITDNYMLLHPESMRFCGFQNVTINVPHAAYLATEAGDKTINGVIKYVLDSMDMAMEAHLRKKKASASMMVPGAPLWQIGKEAADSQPYVDLDSCTYIIGMIGVNDAVKFITGKEMHDSHEALDDSLKILSAMHVKTKEFTEKYNLKVTLEESPAESAARRLAKSDLTYFPQYASSIVKGDIEDDNVYYTNSVHLAADCNIGIVERIKIQGLFHGLIESGAITHAFVGEERPSPASIHQLVKNTFYQTQSAQITISPEFTYCNDCHYEGRGLLDTCEQCGSTNTTGVTRIVGYYSTIENWNKSKKRELIARQAGEYCVEAENKDILTEVRSLLGETTSTVAVENEEESDVVSAVCDGGSCRL